MGILPQEAELYESLSVKQTLRIFGKLRGLNSKDANRRAQELISDLRFEEHRNVVGMKLLGGLKRRVMVGLAALANPRLIIMDEPTTGLDPQSRRDLWTLLREYRERGSRSCLRPTICKKRRASATVLAYSEWPTASSGHCS